MKIKLWKLIEEAQDHYLWDGHDGYHNRYSCAAVYEAYDAFSAKDCDEGMLGEHLDNLAGVEIHNSLDLFNRFASGEERQGARFLWLELAKTIAKEEGIEVHYSSKVK